MRPVGATRAQPVDVRIISATHRDLDELRNSGTFREDLYYRLNVVALDIPSLAERREDIPLLANYFLATLEDATQKEGEGICTGSHGSAAVRALAGQRAPAVQYC